MAGISRREGGEGKIDGDQYRTKQGGTSIVPFLEEIVAQGFNRIWKKNCKWRYWFGIAESTGAAKLKEIRTQCKIRQSDHHWMLPSQLDDHPLIWIIEVNGWPMDVRQAPREIQEAAYRKGLIPYVPADQV
jgi:hypothetical protein